MSSTTVTYRSTARDANMEELRKRQAEARRAAYHAARRAEEKRRREETARRRIKAANGVIADQEANFQKAVVKHDDAARELPDFALTVPDLPALDDTTAREPDRIEDYAAQLRTQVEAFSKQLEAAIDQAQHLLDRRIATAKAWRCAADLEALIAQRAQACQENATWLGEQLNTARAPARPDPDAELETVEAYVSALREHRDAIERDKQKLGARLASRRRAAELGGDAVTTCSAQEALARHEAERRDKARADLAAHRDAELARADLRLDDLPTAVRALIEDAVEQSDVMDQHENVTRWIAREQQHRTGVQRALNLMQSAPDLVHEDETLAQRWATLSAQLQRIASGLDEFGPGVEREYQQLRRDAHRLVNDEFTKADWVQAMREQDFEILERTDSPGLVVVDLENPDFWLEATELEAEQGGFATLLELKTDAEAHSDEAAVTDGICNRLSRAARSTAEQVSTQSEVIEQKPKITRGRRPTCSQKSFSSSL